MFSANKAVILVLALAGPGIALAQSTGQPSAAAATPMTDAQDVPVAEVYLEQQLDWRSYYLNRIDGSRTEGRAEPVPGFRPGV